LQGTANLAGGIAVDKISGKLRVFHGLVDAGGRSDTIRQQSAKRSQLETPT
jgi:hypothetical protein